MASLFLFITALIVAEERQIDPLAIRSISVDIRYAPAVVADTSCKAPQRLD